MKSTKDFKKFLKNIERKNIYKNFYRIKKKRIINLLMKKIIFQT